MTSATQVSPRVGGEDSELKGRWFSLVPMLPKHYGVLYEVGTLDPTTFQWRFRGSIPNPEQFREALDSPNVFSKFAVVNNSDLDTPTGLVMAYNQSPKDGFCYIAASMARGQGVGAIEGFALFARYVFRYWPFRKLYVEAPEPNVAQYASIVKLGLFKEEGRFRDHYYYDHNYWDFITFALYREAAVAFAEDHSTVFVTE